MRSLAWKLMLAFLIVGVSSVLLASLLISLRTQSEFDRFLSVRDQAVLEDALKDYYAQAGAWTGVEQSLGNRPPLSFYSRSVALVDANRVVVLGNHGYAVGERLSSDQISGSTPITVNDQTVGYMLLVSGKEYSKDPPSAQPPETDFLQRLASATITSVLMAALLAVVLGGLFARTLTRPVRELTVATKAMAGGQLDQRVNVRSRDELGELATSFNHMSADLARASQLRKQMTADLAHDLRTPLSILRGYTEGLKDDRLQGSARLYRIMHGEVVHLQRLVDDLRMLSLADAGELSLNRRAVDPLALLERTGLAYIVQAQQQGVTLRVDAPADNLPSISVDTDRLTQVLNNLVSNALHHTTTGEIVLAAKALGQHVQLIVSDTGSGIDPDDLPFIFDRFYRTDKARQRDNDDSSGLGLAIAKAIVEAHGGTLTVTSTPGKGTIFTITFEAVRS
ncbi:MAG: HAMP domain-containing protein [Chloroflexi bacterium]|nr:HAMP domain-containing protein [Chloroflexota bacterium]